MLLPLILPSLWQNKGRVLVSVIAIALGVALGYAVHGGYHRTRLCPDDPARLSAAGSRVRSGAGARFDRNLCGDGGDIVLAAAGTIPRENLNLD